MRNGDDVIGLRLTAVVRAIALAGTVLTAVAHAASHPTQYVATVWQTAQGLPQNSIYDIAQDHDGYLWLATSGGIVRFDGVRFRVFGAADIPSLHSLEVTCLHVSRSGDLWVGTLASGLIRLHGDALAATYTTRDGLPSNFVTSVREDTAGQLWITTSEGIARFRTSRLERYRTHNGKAVREFFLQARDGSMWFRSGMDVVRFGADGSIESPTGGFMVQEARDGSVWIAYHDQYRVVRYYNGVFSDVRLPILTHRRWTGAYPKQGVLAMARDTDGELVLLTPAGLVRADGGRIGPPESARFPPPIEDVPKVFSLLVDREGNRWVGTLTTGLFRLRRAPVVAYGRGEGLSDLRVRTIFQDRSGRVWVGGGSLYWFDGHQFHHVPDMTDIQAIAQSRDGDLWFGGSGIGLRRWRSGVLTRFEKEQGGATGIFEDRHGTLWIIQQYFQSGGLYRFHEGQLERIIPSVRFTAWAEGRDGGLWLGTSEGVRYLRGREDFTHAEINGLPRCMIQDICVDSNGDMWAATDGRGIYRFRNGRFKAITAKDGLHDDSPGGMLDDGEGSLWFNSTHGIFRLRLSELNDLADGRISSVSPISYGFPEGLPGTSETGERGFKALDGRLWFPTVHGAAVIDPAAGNPLPPPVVLEEAWANRLSLKSDATKSVPPGNNTFDFRFTALSLSAPEKTHFKYRLYPYDKDWVDAGNQRTAHYTNMAPASYSFQVIAANSFGVWNAQGASVRFVLRPHFYQTSWFYALCAGVCMAMLWVAYQVRDRQLRRQYNLRLEERVQERTRIARDLHDTLLQSFQGSLYLFQAARNLFSRRPEEALHTLDSAITTAEDAIVEGRTAIQNLRLGPPDRSLQDLLAAVGQEFRDYEGGTGPPVAFHVTVEGQPQTLSPLLQDEIYRIGREVLRNAFHHAHAHRIEAAIQYDPHLFRLRIRDDGKGIDPNVVAAGVRAGHWGLPGIRERAKRIGAQLAVWSQSGAGTEVELTVPARIAYGTARPFRGLPLFRKRKVEM